MLELILNFPFWNPSQYSASLSDPYIEEIQLILVLLTNLDQNVWVGVLDMLEHCSVTSSPGWTSTVWDSETETVIQPETHRDNKRFTPQLIKQQGPKSLHLRCRCLIFQCQYLLRLQRSKAVIKIKLLIVCMIVQLQWLFIHWAHVQGLCWKEAGSFLCWRSYWPHKWLPNKKCWNKIIASKSDCEATGEHPQPVLSEHSI